MQGRIIAIGDIHGCVDALRATIEAIEPNAQDTLITLGDYVDRGPKSKQVIDYLIRLREICTLIPLMGNHEEMMMDVVLEDHPPYDWLRYGGVDTLDSYGFVGDLSVIPPEHRAFLNSLVDSYETENHFFVHANYDPVRPIEDQPVDLLRWVKLSEQLPNPHQNGKRAVCGHTHHRQGEILQLPHLLCLDTYCYGGKWLTAMDMNSGQIWQADKQGQLREIAATSPAE